MALNELTDKRYHGKICERHPGFGGLRLKSSYECVQCKSEKKGGVPRGTMTEEQRLKTKIEWIRRRIDELGAEKVELLEGLKDAHESLARIVPTECLEQ